MCSSLLLDLEVGNGVATLTKVSTSAEAPRACLRVRAAAPWGHNARRRSSTSLEDGVGTEPRDAPLKQLIGAPVIRFAASDFWTTAVDLVRSPETEEHIRRRVCVCAPSFECAALAPGPEVPGAQGGRCLLPLPSTFRPWCVDEQPAASCFCPM